ncbi:hypothetical protein KEM52_003647, partial [Ascosphaera acerosa]
MMRKWGADGVAVDEDPDEVLDYSAAAGEMSDAAPPEDVDADVDVDAAAAAGITTAKGEYVLRDLGDEVDSILAKERTAAADTPAASSGFLNTRLAALSGYLSNKLGGKTLTAADLAQPLRAMEDHLINKNVAREASVQLCRDVAAELAGQRTASFQTADAALRAATTRALRRILTPTSSLDLLHEIQARRGGPQSRPYVISIVGVNGVGKSTNLSKICFFLLQNRLRVLVAACDTFRSGAVEQLRVHVRNLQELARRRRAAGAPCGDVELYEKGYGKDAANVAKDAVAHAAAQGVDVVLIDTAGRRHNDARLMSSLEKFAQLARPDKIFMVAEALVGTDSVMQARNFNAAFGRHRGIDGFIISKCDTVGSMVGTLVSMV